MRHPSQTQTIPPGRTGQMAAALAIVLLVAACGGGATPSPSAAAPGSDAPAATAPATTAPVASSEAGSVSGMTLVFITAGFSSEYQIAQGEWFKQFAEDEGASVSVVDGKFDATVQVKALDDAVAAGVDGIIIQSADPVATAPSVKAARSSGIPVMFVGGTPDASAVVPAGGVFNDEELVRKAARDAVEWLKANKPGDKAKVVVFDIPAVIVCHEWRMVPFVEEITAQIGADNVDVVFNDFVDPTAEGAAAKMEDLIQSGADFNIFSGCGGVYFIGGVQALEQADRAKAVDGVPVDTFIFTIDATPPELEWLVDPTSGVAQTLALTPKKNAQLFLDNFKRILSGEIDADSDLVVPAPGVMLYKADGCESIRDTLADEYAVIPGYKTVDCG